LFTAHEVHSSNTHPLHNSDR